MTPELITELVYTIAALVAAFFGVFVVYNKQKGNSPLYIKMVVWMLGCRFLQGLIEFLLMRSDFDMSKISIVFIGYMAQFLFLICANYGAIDSLCDDGSKKFIKYRLMALVVPLGVLVYYIINIKRLSVNSGDMVIRLICLIVVLCAFYYHIKHLIIKDIEGGIIRCVRLYNLIGVINCIAVIIGWFFAHGSLPWYISMGMEVVVSLTILPALFNGFKKWREFNKNNFFK